MKIRTRGFLIILLPLLTACSSFLYYPSRLKFVEPESLKYPPEEITFYESVKNKDTDITKLVAWYFKTPQKNAKATLVIFHGNAQNLSTHFWSMYWALDKGYNIFIFDYPGYGGSRGRLHPKSTLASGRRAIEYVQQKWPEQKIIVVGQSLGGAIALRAVADLESRKNICAVLADSSFSSYQRIGRKVLSQTWLTWPLQWLPYFVLSDQYAPEGHIEKIAPIPLMVVHREGDPLIPFGEGQRIFDEAKAPKEWHPLKGIGHVTSFTDSDRVENQRLFTDFLKACD